MKKSIIIAAGTIIFVIAILMLISAKSRKLVCKSNKEKITIKYNDRTIKGYSSKNMTYDFDKQKQYAEKVGIEAYINEFEIWFKTHTTGTCTRK